MRRRLGGLRGERGAALVEFALVVPFLMIIMCATIDFGLAAYMLNNLTGAVREGARFAATMSTPPTANDNTVRDRVYTSISVMNSTLTPAYVKGLIGNTAVDPNGNITVTITGYPYYPMTPLAKLVFDSIPLNRKAIFRYERAS
ncbi:MAG: TadE/TadG family type IV pilus assembly protein [bacterium]